MPTIPVSQNISEDSAEPPSAADVVDLAFFCMRRVPLRAPSAEGTASESNKPNDEFVPAQKLSSHPLSPFSNHRKTMQYRTRQNTHYSVAGMMFPAFVIPAHTPCTPAANLPPPQPGFRPYFWLSQLPPTLIDNIHAIRLIDSIGILMLPEEVEEAPLLLEEKSPTPFHVGDVVKLIREGVYSFDRGFNGCTGWIEEVIPEGGYIPRYGNNDLGQLWYRLRFPKHQINASGELMEMYDRNGTPYIFGRCGRNLKLVPAQK
jgi:hypothetical protein